jgi:TonB family protein
MVKVAVYLIAFYLVYTLFLSRDTSYVRNRIFILMSFILSLILPLVNFHTIRPMGIQFFGRFLSDVLVTAPGGGAEKIAPGFVAAESLKLAYYIYILGAAVFILKLITDLLNLLYLILNKKSSGCRIISFNGLNTSGFSALGYVFINTRLSQDEAGEIIRHEQNHLKQNHFIDVIFIEVIKAFQWFNPVVYLFDRSLRAIHEYQADEGCLSAGVPVVNYQCLLLNQVFKSKVFNLTNSFSNPSLVKKRMIMMTKKRTSAFANLKLLIVIPVTFVILLAISAYREIPVSPVSHIIPKTAPHTLSSTIASTLPAVGSIPDKESDPTPSPLPSNPSMQKNDGSDEKASVVKKEQVYETETTPFVVVEEMPMFPGGDRELLKFLASNTRYPETAKINNIQGRVIVRFCVTAQGGVSMISVLKGVHPELDAEALRVVQTLPRFEPGKQDGKAVPVWYMVPITFTLK